MSDDTTSTDLVPTGFGDQQTRWVHVGAGGGVEMIEPSNFVPSQPSEIAAMAEGRLRPQVVAFGDVVMGPKDALRDTAMYWVSRQRSRGEVARRALDAIGRLLESPEDVVAGEEGEGESSGDDD